jgi:hypothetical protein
MATLGIPRTAPPSAPWIILGKPLEMEKKIFDKAFRNATKIEAAGHAYSKGTSITSPNMDDCITIFGIEKVGGQRKGIFGVLIQLGPMESSTINDDVVDMVENLKGYAAETKQFEIYIVGGNKASLEGGFLEAIHEAIKTVFMNNGHIAGEFTDLNAGQPYQYVSANLQLNETLTICRHD